jgi:phosphatidylinositol phospholipase C beta
MDGITKLHFTHVYAENWESAKIFADSVNKFAHHLLDHHLSVQMYMKKHYVRMCLEANGRGQLPLKTVTKYMMVQKSSKDDIKSYFVSAKTNVKEMDNGTPYIEIKEFTEAIYMNLVDTLLQNRGPDLDVLKKEW